MPELHSILQDSGILNSGSAFAPSELPTVESILAPAANVRVRACDSTPCLRAVLATLASVTAIVLLVYYCSGVYGRRAVNDPRSRRLASSGDSDASDGPCTPDDDEAHQQDEEPRQSNSPDNSEWRLPIKKRKLARAAVSVAAGDGHYAQQREQQQAHRHETAAAVSLAETGGHHGPQQLSVRSPFPTDVRTPKHFDAATGDVESPHDQRDVAYFTPHTSKSGNREMMELERQILQMRKQVSFMIQQLQRKRPHPEQHQGRLQQEHDKSKLHQQHSYLYGYQQVQQGQWQYFPEQQQQQPLLQQQQQQLQPQGPLPAIHDSERQQPMQQEGHQVKSPEEREKGQEKEKGRQEEYGKPEHGEGAEQRLLQPTGPLTGPLLEDEWIAVDPPELVAPQPSTSQQVLQASASATGARPVMSEHPTMQAPTGYPLVPLRQAPAAATAGASKDETAAAVTTGADTGRAATAVDLHAADLSAAASPTEGKECSTGAPVLCSLLSGGSSAAVAATGTSITSLVSITPFADLQAMLDSARESIENHPFVRLPRRGVEGPPTAFHVDMERACTADRCRRHAFPMLRKAHDLLSREVLYPIHLKQLAAVVEELVAHAMRYEHASLRDEMNCRANERLGARFLILDAVVSAFTVLGQAPEGKWWDAFAETISGEPPLLTPRAFYMGLLKFNSNLAQGLSSAIQTLKTGKRPSPEDLFTLKMMLFCHPYSPRRFRGLEYDSWRLECPNKWKRTGP